MFLLEPSLPVSNDDLLPPLFPVDDPLPVPLSVLLCPELLFRNQEYPELVGPLLFVDPVDPEDDP